MEDKEQWRSLWLSGAVSESEFRRLREDSDHAGAGRALAEASTGRDLAAVSARWGGANVECVERERLPARLRRAMSGSYLTVAGTSATLSLPSVAIVGTRGVPARTAPRIRALVDGIVRSSVSVVSGGAYGVDTMCHEAALEAGVPATIVIAGGLLHPSPAGNRRAFDQIVREGGAVVTDRSPGRPPHRRDFVRRNALIAALADVVVVAAAPAKSGALETARVADRLGVPVLAVPGMFDDPVFEGCHELFRKGAGVCTGPADVARALGVQPALPLAPAPRRPALSSLAARTLAWVEDGLSTDQIVRESGVELAAVHRALLELQLEGLIAD